MRTLIFALALVSCGGDDGDKHAADAQNNGSGSGSGSSTACAAQSTYGGTLGSNAQYVVGQDPASSADIAWRGTLGGSNPYDLLTIELWTGANSADFPTGPATGTFDFSKNNNSKFLSCGVCAYLQPQAHVDADGNIDGGYDKNQELYEAESGTMMITDVGTGSGTARTGTFSGTLHDVVLKHHHVGSGDASTETEAADACQTTIYDLAFNATFGASAVRLIHRHN